MKGGFHLLLALLLTAGPAMAARYSRPIRQGVEAIRNERPRDGLPCLCGYRDGYPGYAGAYIRFFPRIYGNATRQDVERMLQDPSPAVRLVGASVALNYHWAPPALNELAKDDTVLSVGPFPKDEFRRMKVSEVLREMQFDRQFLLRYGSATSVRLDYIRELSASTGSSVVVGRLPVYQVDMANAGINGDVTAIIRFGGGSQTPEIQIIKASHREFADSVTWALSKWELANAGAAGAATTAEFECRVVFTAAE